MRGGPVTAALPNDVDACAMPGRRRHALVQSDKCGVEGERECDIGRVVCGEVRPETPNRREERLMRMVDDIQVGEVCEGFRSTLGGHVAERYVPAQDLGYLDGQEVRRVQGLLIGGDPRRHFGGEG